MAEIKRTPEEKQAEFYELPKKQQKILHDQAYDEAKLENKKIEIIPIADYLAKLTPDTYSPWPKYNEETGKMDCDFKYNVSIDEYFSAYEECFKNPGKIKELLKNLSPEMKREIAYPIEGGDIVNKASDEEVEHILENANKKVLISNLFGLRDDGNPRVYFSLSVKDDMRKYLEEKLFKNFKKYNVGEVDPKDKSGRELKTDLYVNAGTKDLEFRYLNIEGTLVDVPFNTGNFLDDRTKEEKNDLTMLEAIKEMIEKLRSDPNVSQIYLYSEHGRLNPYWERENN